MSTQRNPARETIDQTEGSALVENGMLITSEQSRPLYFDGRFLKAEDLASEQNYFLKRQAALNSAHGFGVTRGLSVSQKQNSSFGLDAFSVVIGKGSGVTPSGESVVIEADLPVNLANTERIALFDAAVGIAERTAESRTIEDPVRSQTGVFILGLRLVEYYAGNVPSFPTSNEGLAARTISTRKGEIVEATAITLVRYGDLGDSRARSRIAGDIFSGKTIPQEPASLLPLAMIALQNNRIQWIDNFLVRRELGNVASGPLGLQTVPRALRFAHLQQYNQQLSELESGSLNNRFSARSYFERLPAAGRLPKAAVSTQDFSQTYFPPEISVQLTAVPTDEIAALIEDSMALPPINLRASAAELESLSLLMVIPMKRQALMTLRRSLAAAATSPPPNPSSGAPTQPVFQPISINSFQPLDILRKPLTLSVPGEIAKRKPLEKLYALKHTKRSRFQPIPEPISEQTVDSLWQQALEDTEVLWYVRQRNIPYQSDIVGTAVPLAGDDATLEQQVNDRIAGLDLTDRFTALQNNTGAIAEAEIVTLLGSAKINSSDLLFQSVIKDLENNQPTESNDNAIARSTVTQVADRFGNPRLGEGIERLEAVTPAFKENNTIIKTLVESGKVIELDQIARTLSANELNTFGKELANLAEQGNADEISSLIRNRSEVIQ